MISRLIKAAIGTKAVIAFYAAIAGALVTIAISLWQWGHNSATAECTAAAKDAEIQSLTVDRNGANERATRSEAIIRTLNRQREINAAAIARLEKALGEASAKKIEPSGEKHDPSALLDEHGRYTRRGILLRLQR